MPADLNKIISMALDQQFLANEVSGIFAEISAENLAEIVEKLESTATLLRKAIVDHEEDCVMVSDCLTPATEKVLLLSLSDDLYKVRNKIKDVHNLVDTTIGMEQVL